MPLRPTDSCRRTDFRTGEDGVSEFSIVHRSRWLFAPILLAQVAAAAPAPTAPAPGDRVFLAKHCLGCHAGEDAERGLDLETLITRPFDDETAEHWAQIHGRVRAGEMPPADTPRPTADEVRRFLEPIEKAVVDLQAREGRVARRRLNRTEYQHTMQDLLGIRRDLTGLLPEDQAAFGFDKLATALPLSATHVERYMEAADVALDDALGLGKQPQYTGPERYPAAKVIQGHNSQIALPNGDHAVFAGLLNPFGTWSIRAPGRYAFRFRARTHEAGGQPVILRVYAGHYYKEALGAASSALAHFEVPPEGKEFEHVAWMEPGRCFYFEPVGVASWDVNMKKPPHDGVAFEWMEIEGPLDSKAWPPATRGRLLGDVALDTGTLGDARRVLARFAPRAFRRPVADADLEPYLGVVRAELDHGAPFPDALKAGLLAVLVSPRFLLLEEQPGWLDDHALACRLSYFLWGTMPDDELTAAAARGELKRNREVFRRQVERMLAHDKARAFVEDFPGQWLDLRRIEATSPDTQLYPEFNVLLQESMVAETRAFFAEILRNDLPLTNFLDSDFAIVNGPLAALYGIPGVEGLAMRRVSLKPAWRRGGVLGQAAILKVTANGTTTSPVIRGFWVADRLLGQATPPPPAGVPAVDPDIRGATSIREQLARHRADPACAGCHAKAEPLGFALENYDVIGGWRDRYRIAAEPGKTAETVPVTVDRKQRPVAVGAVVDAADMLADGRRFTDLAQLKALLLADPEAVARGLTRKLLAYATGRAPTLADEAEVDGLVKASAAGGYKFRSLVHAITESNAFRHK